MILIGQYDSPFVRRVAITLHHYGMGFERRAISVFGDFEAALATNPLGKVPALALDNGEVLFDSQMILDHLDETVGPTRALTPAAGPARRAVLRRSTVALGLAEKAIALRGELYRRAEGTQDPAVTARLERQIGSALDWLEAQRPDPWFADPKMGQDDVTAAVVVTFLMRKPPKHFDPAARPALAALNRRAEALPAFAAAPFVEE